VLKQFNLNGHCSGDQRILRYQANHLTIIVPAIELIRSLLLHSRVLAESLLLPSGLLELAVTPLPGIYNDIKIEFTNTVPRKLLTLEFAKEFTWLSINPDGRLAWDSVRRLPRSTQMVRLRIEKRVQCLFHGGSNHLVQMRA
jgi:hypothetical protein